jgi:hypothetical protein
MILIIVDPGLIGVVNLDRWTTVIDTGNRTSSRAYERSFETRTGRLKASEERVQSVCLLPVRRCRHPALFATESPW